MAMVLRHLLLFQSNIEIDQGMDKVLFLYFAVPCESMHLTLTSIANILSVSRVYAVCPQQLLPGTLITCQRSCLRIVRMPIALYRD